MACWARLGASGSPSVLLKGCGAMMKLEKDGVEGFGGKGGLSGSLAVGIILGESSGCILCWLIVLDSRSLLGSTLEGFSSGLWWSKWLSVATFALALTFPHGWFVRALPRDS